MIEEVYVRKGDDEVVEVVIETASIELHPLPYIKYNEGDRYGFLGLRRAKETLYSDVYDWDETLYTRQEFIDTFKIDPENDIRPKFSYSVKIVRRSGRSRYIPFNSVDNARDWIKSQYPEYSERVE